MDRDLIPDCIELRIYVMEAVFVEKYLIMVWENLRQLKNMAPEQDFQLVEYYKKQFSKDVVRLKRHNKTSKAYAIKMPLSVARILWKNWQHELINDYVQRVLHGIDKELCNYGLKPI